MGQATTQPPTHEGLSKDKTQLSRPSGLSMAVEHRQRPFCRSPQRSGAASPVTEHKQAPAANDFDAGHRRMQRLAVKRPRWSVVPMSNTRPCTLLPYSPLWETEAKSR